MIPKTLSASSLQVANLCLARWVAEYIERTPGFSNNAADVGTSVHGGLELFVKAVYIDKEYEQLDRVRRKELLITFYRLSYVQTFNTADMDTEEYKDGFDLTMKWFARTNLDSVSVESAELKETIKVPYNHPDGTVHELDFNYIMDRVDQTGPTTWEVVDYKTIRVPISPEDLETKVQARAYALAIQIKHPECTQVKVTFDLLRHEPVSMTMTRDDNIRFWQYLTSEVQRLVDLQEADAVTTLNPECGYCAIKYTCPAMQKNIAPGGYHSLDIDAKAKLLGDLQFQAKGYKAIIEDLEEALMKYAAKADSLQWETADGSTIVEIGLTAARRQFDPQRAAEVMGPELFATMASMTIGNLEKIIKDESLDSEMRDQLKSLLHKGNGNLKAFVKQKKTII